MIKFTGHTPPVVMDKTPTQPKIAIDLIPPEWAICLAHLATKGAEKYAPRDWEKPGLSYMARIGSLKRHLESFLVGEDFDEETGAHQLIAVAFNALMVATHDLRKTGNDDRPDCAAGYLRHLMRLNND